MEACRPTWPCAVLALLLACSGSDPTGSDTGDPTGPGTGSIEVTSVTTGESPDPDGYLLTLDGHSSAIPTNATTVFRDLAPGDHGLELGGIASNCTLDGAATLTVPVAAGAAARVQLDITCLSLARSLEITTITAGDPLDPDGYAIVLDGVTRRPIGLNETVTVDGVMPGSHTLWLQGVAFNCRAPGNPRGVTVAGDNVQVRYDVACGVSNDVGVMLFTSDRGGVTHLYRMRDDGREIVDLTPSDESFGGDWSPDGSRIAFQLMEGNTAALYLMNGDGSARTPLHANGGSPTWSPDGQRIAFSNGAIQVVNADGSDGVDLGPGGQPDWSPDGTRIAFDLVDRGHCVPIFALCPSGLYVMQADGSARRKLVDNIDPSDQFTSPAWSPDGTRIAYARQCCLFGPNVSGLWIMNLAGGSLERIYSGRVRGKPVWSPDGSTIAFGAVDLVENSDLLVIPSTGGDTTVLVSRRGSEYPTSWK